MDENVPHRKVTLPKATLSVNRDFGEKGRLKENKYFKY